MTIDEIISVLQGVKEGKLLECRRRGVVDFWHPILVASNHTWDFLRHDYRLKPEPREFWVWENTLILNEPPNKPGYIKVREVLE